MDNLVSLIKDDVKYHWTQTWTQTRPSPVPVETTQNVDKVNHFQDRESVYYNEHHFQLSVWKRSKWWLLVFEVWGIIVTKYSVSIRKRLKVNWKEAIGCLKNKRHINLHIVLILKQQQCTMITDLGLDCVRKDNKVKLVFSISFDLLKMFNRCSCRWFLPG